MLYRFTATTFALWFSLVCGIALAQEDDVDLSICAVQAQALVDNAELRHAYRTATQKSRELLEKDCIEREIRTCTVTASAELTQLESLCRTAGGRPESVQATYRGMDMNQSFDVKRYNFNEWVLSSNEIFCVPADEICSDNKKFVWTMYLLDFEAAAMEFAGLYKIDSTFNYIQTDDGLALLGATTDIA
ncbi:hypothetical protein MPSEU_000976900 [Mayamaea pseudoterrestris]|nr:hypothetical protein MPSEU_000976900 [Mayamaea pseudoterrestris]